jgi:hypothetical protein
MYGMRFEFVWVLPTTGELVSSFSREGDSCAIMGGVAEEGGTERERRQLFALMFYHKGVIISSSKLCVRRGAGGGSA